MLRARTLFVLAFISCGGEGGGSGSGSADDDGGTVGSTAPDGTADDAPTSADDGPTSGPADDSTTGCTTDCTTDTDIIPAERRIDWTFAGVPGGIPQRETICQTIEWSADVTDYTPVIQAAIDACPPDQVVMLSPGSFPLAGRLVLGNAMMGITLRGSGPDQTELVSTDVVAIELGTDAVVPLDVAITGGTQKASDRLELASIPPELTVDSILVIDRENDPELVHEVTPSGVRRMTQLFIVTAIEGNEIAIEPPLVFDFSADPHLALYSQTGRFHGVEDLSVERSGATGLKGTYFLQSCYGCWLRNVESHVPPAYHVVATNTLRCEIRDSYLDDSQTYGHDNGGVVLYGNNTGWKIENNVFSRNFPGVELNYSSNGNVIAYNYSSDVRGGDAEEWPMAACDFNDNHGPHNLMNLYEGNVGTMFMSDAYFGSSSHGTLFRNHFGAAHPTYPTGNRQAVSLKRWSYSYNVVGNVLGDTDWPANGEYEIEVEYGYDIAVIYQLGFPDIGNNSLPDGVDAQVKATLLRHGNWDYDTADVVWDPAIEATELPASLIYAGAPQWWPATTPWPPIGPDVEGLTSEIPAQERAHAAGLP